MAQGIDGPMDWVCHIYDLISSAPFPKGEFPRPFPIAGQALHRPRQLECSVKVAARGKSARALHRPAEHQQGLLTVKGQS